MIFYRFQFSHWPSSLPRTSSGNEFAAFFFFILNCRTSYPSPAAQTHVIIGSFNVTWADARIITKVRSADSAEKRNIDSAPCRIGRIFPCDARRCNRREMHSASTQRIRHTECSCIARDRRVFRTPDGGNGRNCDYQGPSPLRRGDSHVSS